MTELPREKTQVEILKERLAKTGARLGGVTLGDGNPTKEDVAGEINKALDAIERGDYEEIENLDD